MICGLLVWVLGIGQSSVALGQQSSGIRTAPPATTITVDRTAEFNVKAVYLYNFARYIEWPRRTGVPSDALHIGVVGESRVMAPLRKIAKFRKVANKRTGVHQPIVLSQFQSVEECRPCHILFVAESIDAKQINEIQQRFKTQPVLIVGETANFATAGGGAAFLLVEGGIRFDLNLDQTNAKRLKLDAKLLKAANHIVHKSAINSVSQK